MLPEALPSPARAGVAAFEAGVLVMLLKGRPRGIEVEDSRLVRLSDGDAGLQPQPGLTQPHSLRAKA